MRDVLPDNWQEAGFGLYIHWPFCAAKCPYCDFNSHVTARIDQTRWAQAYVREIVRCGAETEGRVLRSVFFGGGTPSLMDVETVEAVLNAVRDTWRLANDCEITLEANPTSVEAGRFAGYRDAGVNRVSMGVQALNDADLKALGRLHTADEAMAAFDIARGTFDRVSFDLMYGRQNQTAADWEAELRRAVDLAVDHLSLYQLTIEDGTAFGDRFQAGRLRGLPDEDRSVEMWEVTQAVTAEAGLPSYEVSNHARVGAESQHNLIYWRSGDWVGIGPGAHGRLTMGGQRWATETALQPGAWLADVEARGSGETEREPLSEDAWGDEALLMGLRLIEGVTLKTVNPWNQEYYNNINYLIDEGLLSSDSDRLWVTETGRPLLNAVIRRILDA